MRLIKTEQDWISNELKVKETMTRMPFTVASEVPIFQAKEIMKGHKIRHMPVLDSGELKGIVSDRDIRTAESFRGPGFLTVGDAMTTPPYTVHPDTPLVDVLNTLFERKISSALVVSPRGIVIGIFTAHDAIHLLKALVLLGDSERVPKSENIDDRTQTEVA